jgi:hypothetical protein
MQAPPPEHCNVVELRRYTLHPGRRDALIDLFDREFIEAQEDVGMRVIGQFRNAADPLIGSWEEFGGSTTLRWKTNWEMRFGRA